MKALLLSLLLAFAWLAPSPAFAQDFGHGRQFGVRAALVAGYRMILRYDDSAFCKREDFTMPMEEPSTFCGHGAPLALDVAASFAPLDFLEPFLWMRFGLAGEEDTYTASVFTLGAGARLYTMSDSPLKIYVEPAIGWGLENGEEVFGESADLENDLLFHLAAGPQIDLAQNVGLYADAGITLGVLRALAGSLELKAGVQARFP